jgi:hypothetical protein
MRRKTAPKAPLHPEVSGAMASDGGLIAKAGETAQSAMGKNVLDNRSHRTPKAQSHSASHQNMSGAPTGAHACRPDLRIRSLHPVVNHSSQLLV